MALTKEQIQQIAAQTRSSFETGSFAPTGVQCLFDDVHDAIDTAIRAQHQLMDMSLEERGKLIEAMRVCAPGACRRACHSGARGDRLRQGAS